MTISITKKQGPYIPEFNLAQMAAGSQLDLTTPIGSQSSPQKWQGFLGDRIFQQPAVFALDPKLKRDENNLGLLMPAAIPVVAMALSKEVQSLVEDILNPKLDYHDDGYLKLERLHDLGTKGNLDAIKGLLEISEKSPNIKTAISALFLASDNDIQAPEIKKLQISFDLSTLIPKIMADNSELVHKAIYYFHKIGNPSATIILQTELLSFESFDLLDEDIVSLIEEAAKLGNAAAIKCAENPKVFRDPIRAYLFEKKRRPQRLTSSLSSNEQTDLTQIIYDHWNNLSPAEKEGWRQIESDQDPIPSKFIEHILDNSSQKGMIQSVSEEEKKKDPGKKGGPKGMH